MSLTEASDGVPEPCEAVQIITDKKKFDSNAANILKKGVNLESNGFEYHVVSIMGSQSTGKSTILNQMFNTSFDVMSEDERKQTTKGIWISLSSRGNVIVLDVEGTDGCERGDDKDFERKSSLFSLTVSEVLIINVWETQIGLYTGSNINLLRTVFDVNIHLFGNERDYIGGTPFENLKRTLTNRLEEMWNDIVKPDNCAKTNLSDFFDIDFSGVPHKIYANNEFIKVVEDVSKRFLDKSNQAYIFKSEYNRGIPSDGLFPYLERIWDIIKNNEELNLPCQQKLLAKFKCDELSLLIYNEFTEELNNIQEIHQKGYMVPNLGKTMDVILKRLIDIHISKTFRYDKEICQESRNKLSENMLESLEKCCTKQLELFSVESINRFSNNINESLQKKLLLREFVNESKKSLEREVYLFDNTLKESKPQNVTWDFNNNKNNFVDTLNNELEKSLVKKLNLIISEYTNECVSEVKSVFIEELENKSPDIWHSVFKKFSEKFADTKKTITSVLENDAVSNKQIEPAIKNFCISAFTSLISLIKEEVDDVKLVERTVDVFISKLIYNDEGIARPFYTKADVDTAFIRAKVACESYARLLSKIDVSKNELPSEVYSNENFNQKMLVLVPAGKLAVLLRHVGHICEGKFMDVKGRIVSNRKGLPLWAMIAIVLLGWNEVMIILRNPLYLIICAAMALTAYLAWCLLYSDSLLNHFFRRFPQVMPKPILEDVSWSSAQDSQRAHMKRDSQSINEFYTGA